MRFMARFLSLICLVAAVLAGVVDSVQSVASQTVSLTPIGVAIFSLNPGLLAAAESYSLSHFPAFVWNGIAEWVLLQPAFAVLLVLSLLLWMAGWKREPALRGFAA